MSRAVLLCPGRGSYAEKQLGSLPPDHELVRAAERLRGDHGLEPLLAWTRRIASSRPGTCARRTCRRSSSSRP